MIYQLKRAGINQNDLAFTYLPKYLSDNIEIIQKRCLRTVFHGFTYEDILEMVNLPTLLDRRNEICKAYFGRMRRGEHKLDKLLPDTRMVHKL